MVAADPATADSVRAGGQVLRLHRSGSKGEGLRDVVQEHRCALRPQGSDSCADAPPYRPQGRGPALGGGL